MQSADDCKMQQNKVVTYKLLHRFHTTQHDIRDMSSSAMQTELLDSAMQAAHVKMQFSIRHFNR